MATRSSQGEWGGWDTWHAWARRERCSKVLVGKPKGKRAHEKPRHRWVDGIRMDITEIGWGVWSGFSWPRIGTGGGLSWTQWWTFWRRGVSIILDNDDVHFTQRSPWVLLCVSEPTVQTLNHWWRSYIILVHLTTLFSNSNYLSSIMVLQGSRRVCWGIQSQQTASKVGWSL
jgi:hypothetical protein